MKIVIWVKGYNEHSAPDYQKGEQDISVRSAMGQSVTLRVVVVPDDAVALDTGAAKP